MKGVSKKYEEFIMKIISASRLLVLAGTLAAMFLGGSHAFATNNSSACLDPTQLSSYKMIALDRGYGEITTKDGKPLCSDGNLVYESFNLPDTWKGTLTWDARAIPQTEFARTEVTIPANTSNYVAKATVATPEACKGTQMDWYLAPGVTRIDTLDGDNAVNIAGLLFAGQGECEAPKPVVKNIDVCKLDTKTKTTIDETTFDSKKYSKTVSDCDITPAATPTTPSQTAAELPHTGIASIFGGGLGLSALAAATTAYIRSRRS